MRLMLRSELNYQTLGTFTSSPIPSWTELGPYQKFPHDKRRALVMVRRIIVAALALGGGLGGGGGGVGRAFGGQVGGGR